MANRKEEHKILLFLKQRLEKGYYGWFYEPEEYEEILENIRQHNFDGIPEGLLDKAIVDYQDKKQFENQTKVEKKSAYREELDKVPEVELRRVLGDYDYDNNADEQNYIKYLLRKNSKIIILH